MLRCPRARQLAACEGSLSGHTSRNAHQKPSAPSPIATAGGRRPRPRRSRSTLAQLSSLSR